MSPPIMTPPPVSAARLIRVLVVDDSAYMRHVIGQAINAAPDLDVVGAARDGREALAQISALNPDVVTLDLEMPNLDGLATLREIMARFPRPVIILSSFTTEGARETVQALLWGAVDFVAKPSLRANVATVMDSVIAKVRLAMQAQVTRPSPLALGAPEAEGRARATPRPLRARDKVVVIGASTGGPRALKTILADLPVDLPAAVLLVQHLPARFTSMLAERLDSLSPLPVKEAQAGDDLQAGCCLLAPGGFHLTLDKQGRVALDQTPAVHGVRPALDVTLAAVARRYGRASVGVVLTGMGVDGARGAGLIRAAGGQVIAEAKETAVVWGMPRSVIDAGLADTVAPLPELAAAIRRAALKGAAHGA